MDTCIVIYLVESNEELGTRYLRRLTDPDATVCVSGLVRMECLVGPLRSGNAELKLRYDEFFELVETLPIAVDAFESAAEIRAAEHLTLPDALHLAVAESHACDEFWTTDRHFKKFQGRKSIQVCLIE